MKLCYVWLLAILLIGCAAHPYQETWVVREVKETRFRVNDSRRWFRIPPGDTIRTGDTLVMLFHQKNSAYPTVRPIRRGW